LEAQLKQLEEESKKIQADLDNKKGERKGLENELSIINDKIRQSKNAISQTQTKIKKLTGDISVKESNIMTLSQKIQQDVKYVTATLNNMRKLDDVRAVIAFSSEGDFADLFKDFGDYKVIQGELSTRMDSLRTNKKFEEVEKDQLIDKKDEAGGEMSLLDIIRYSSNVGCAKIIEEIGHSKQQDFFERLHLLKKIESDIPEIGKPIYPKKWSHTSAVTMSYGHGIAISPLHFATTISALLRNTYLMPRFIKYENELIQYEPIIQNKSSEMLKEVMWEVVKSGSGKRAKIANYEIGGKSGTAIKQSHGVYDYNKMLLSFVAAFPISNPEYLIFVTLDEPLTDDSTSQYIRAGNILGPVTAEIISITAPMLIFD
jgi:hypothetical protein